MSKIILLTVIFFYLVLLSFGLKIGVSYFNEQAADYIFGASVIAAVLFNLYLFFFED